MPRVTTVNKARVDQGACGKCSTPIKVGSPYRWWKFRYGGRRVRCMNPACAPRPSDLTQSEFLGTLYDIEETVSTAVAELRDGGEPSDCAQALRDAAEELRNLGTDCQDKLDNMPESLQQGDTGQLLENRAQECESKADELDSAADEIDSVELETDVDRFIEREEFKREENETDEDFRKRAEAAMKEYNDNLRDEAAGNGEVDLSID